MDLFDKEGAASRKKLGAAKFNKNINELEDKIDLKISGKTRHINTMFLILFICLIIGTSILLYLNINKEPSFNKLYTAIPVYNSPIKKSVTSNISEVQKFYLYYTDRSYQKSIESFTEIKTPIKKDSLYLAIAFFQLDNNNKALSILKSIQRDTNPKHLKEFILWYQALANIKLNQISKSKDLLNVIIKMNGDFKRQAQEILANFPKK